MTGLTRQPRPRLGRSRRHVATWLRIDEPLQVADDNRGAHRSPFHWRELQPATNDFQAEWAKLIRSKTNRLPNGSMAPPSGSRRPPA